MAPHPLATAITAITAITATLHGQVGYDPARSPYRDIRSGTYIAISGGQFFGNGGQVGVAPHDGPTASLQMHFLADRSLSILAGVHYGWLDRALIDPDKTPAEQVTGSATHGTLWVDAGFHFNITGNKTWHGLAPYLGGAVGLGFTETVSADPGDFRMGTKFTLTPLVGTRIFLFGNSYLLAEGRFQFWQIKYPTSYAEEPADDPGTPANPNAVIPTGVLSEWSVTPWVRVGLGFPWRWPF